MQRHGQLRMVSRVLPSKAKDNLMRRKKRGIQSEEGAIVIEATLSLTLFMFVIVMILSFVNLCIAQAKIGIALNQTAKEISQYCYIYSLSGLNEIQETLNDETAGVKSDVEDAEDAVYTSLSGIIGLAKGETSAEEMFSTVGSSMDTLEEIAEKVATSKDRKAWILSVLKICGNEGYEALKGLLGSRLITPYLWNFQRVLHTHAATQEVPRHTRLHSRGSTRVPPTFRGVPFPPPSSRGGILSLRGPERIPGVSDASQEEALSTGKARGSSGSCHHSQSPPEVSVHSRETCFPCTASTFKPRIDSHHGGTWDSPVESLVGKPRGKASRESP